jgi:hypothetical protein
MKDRCTGVERGVDRGEGGDECVRTFWEGERVGGRGRERERARGSEIVRNIRESEERERERERERESVYLAAAHVDEGVEHAGRPHNHLRAHAQLRPPSRNISLLTPTLNS